MKVFAAMYCSCTHESDYGVISLHASEAGAQAAVEKHRRKESRLYKGAIPDWVRHKVEPMKVKP